MTCREVPAWAISRGDRVWRGPAGWWVVESVSEDADSVVITVRPSDPRSEVEIDLDPDDLIVRLDQ